MKGRTGWAAKTADLLLPEQTLFALPFAWMGVLFAGGAGPRVWLLVTLALAAARTAGMAFNRAIDARIDAANPRTKDRVIPRGEVTAAAAAALGAVSSLALIAASYLLNPLCFLLSFPAVLLLAGYPYFKRFSASSHFCLGAIESAAPIGGYLAAAGRMDPPALLLGAGILLWIAGLDMIYALQDEAFDRGAGLHSVPAAWGRAGALALSAVCYALALCALAAAGALRGMTLPYWASVAGVAALFAWQQKAARGPDPAAAMKKIFGANIYISPALLAGALLDGLAR